MLLSDDKQVLALLLYHCLELRVVSVDGTMTNSGEVLWYGRRQLRETERKVGFERGWR
jgi:hypothetical protein